MKATNICPLDGCEAVRHAGKLLCDAHWSLVPADLQSALWSAWRDTRHLRGIGQDDRAANLRRYEAARQRAIEAASKTIESML